MKCLAIAAVAATALIATPALASGKSNGIKVGVGVSTGKNGLVGSLLGGSKGKSNGVAAVVNVSTGKNGVLGALLGGKSNHGRGGHHGGW